MQKYWFKKSGKPKVNDRKALQKLGMTLDNIGQIKAKKE